MCIPAPTFTLPRIQKRGLCSPPEAVERAAGLGLLATGLGAFRRDGLEQPEAERLQDLLVEVARALRVGHADLQIGR